MESQFSRTQLLIGEQGLDTLKNSRVAVFGVGGVGGYTAEALARAGIGALDFYDNDVVSLTNINRQIIATHQTLGMSKVELAAKRAESINPSIIVHTHPMFYSPQNSCTVDLSVYDYIVDAIDTVTCKLQLIACARQCGTPIISCMGAGNKMRPTMFEVADIYSTSVCPLAKVMRRELKKRGIDSLKVVYSKEQPLTPPPADSGKQVPGSISFVPSVAGLILASEVVMDLLR